MQYISKMKFLALVFLLSLALFGAKSVHHPSKSSGPKRGSQKPIVKPLLPAPGNVSIVWAEQTLDIFWDSLPGALGYHLYTAPTPGTPKEKKRRINPALITSGPHFTYLWDMVDHKRERRVKGYRHCITVSAVFDSLGSEGGMSSELCTDYFAGFSRMDDTVALALGLTSTMETAPLPSGPAPMTRSDFLAFMAGTGRRFADAVRVRLDPRVTGGCMPLSTIAVQLFKEKGLEAVRAEGLFIKEFHAFVIVNVEGVEYVVDFASDQFLPAVAPVVIPRDLCFLSPNGRPAKTGIPMYRVERFVRGGDAVLADNEEAQPYRQLLDSLKSTL